MFAFLSQVFCFKNRIVVLGCQSLVFQFAKNLLGNFLENVFKL